MEHWRSWKELSPQIIQEYASSTTGRVRSDCILRLSIAQGMIFGLMDGAKENMKIIVRAIENLSILSGWALPVLLGAHWWTNCIWNYSHDLQCAKVENQYFELFRYIFCDMENLIILFNRARRFLLGTQERRVKHLLGESQNELLESIAVVTYVFQHVSTCFRWCYSLFVWAFHIFLWNESSLFFYIEASAFTVDFYIYVCEFCLYD
jgi:hypothetical protein